MTGLVLEKVSRSFAGHAAADAIDLTVQPGEVVCLLGPSGCGKTTTLRVAAGLESADSGRVTIGDQVMDDTGAFVPPEARNVGLVFQDFALFPHLDVRANVEFGIGDQPPDARRRVVDELLERMNLAAHASTFPHTLSGGEQQRVALARALAPGPKVMLMDEPFSGLDFRLRDQVGEETLALLRQLGTATLMVTHDSDEAMRLGDRVALMNRGRIIQQGTPADIYHHPVDVFTAKFFSEINLIEGFVKGNSIATEMGPIAAPDLADGTPVSVCLRPESLALSQGGDGGRDGVAATVLSARNMGPYDLVWLKPVAGVAKYLARLGPGTSPASGVEVQVAVAQSGCFVFAD
jgi:iron(III) transport system ATP-binding protein